MIMLECENLCKRYGKNAVLNNINFAIESDKITGVIGRNGAGKTTLLRIITGYISPNSGRVKVFGENPYENIKTASKIIYVDDNMAFPGSMTLDDVVKAAARFYGKFDSDLAGRLMKYFDIDNSKNHLSLSKGITSLFNSIIGIASHSDITILDEPTTGMDASIRKDFYKLLLKDYINNPRTILISSHQLQEIEDILEEILLIKQGEILTHMQVNDMKDSYIGVQGSKTKLEELLNGVHVLHKESFGFDGAYAVIKNEGSFIDSIIHDRDVKVVPLSAEDICIYLTSEGEEKIEDVI